MVPFTDEADEAQQDLETCWKSQSRDLALHHYTTQPLIFKKQMLPKDIKRTHLTYCFLQHRTSLGDTGERKVGLGILQGQVARIAFSG